MTSIQHVAESTSLPRRAAVAVLAAALLPTAVIAFGLLLVPHANFTRWDNLEVFLPSIWSYHGRILDGDFPHWAREQLLGQPAHALGVGGALYPPYTLAVWLAIVTGGGPSVVMPSIFLFHLPVAGLGLFLFVRSWGVRPVLALVASVSGVVSGFVLWLGSVWVHVLPTLTWQIWALLGIKKMVDGGHPVAAAASTAAFLTASQLVGHPQPAVYTFAVVLLFAVGYAAIRRRWRSLLEVGVVAGAAVLLAAPASLPTWELARESERREPLAGHRFLDRAVEPAALLGLLLPTYDGADGFADDRRLSTVHLGAWLIPALLAAGLERSRRRFPGATPMGTSESSDRRSSSEAPPKGALALCAGLGALVVLLSLGASGVLYRLTSMVPVWSSFRWPFKLFPFAIPLLAAAGAMALEDLARRPRGELRRAIGPGLALGAGLAWARTSEAPTPSDLVATLAGLGAMGAVAWVHHPRGRQLLLLLSVVGAAALFPLTHHEERFKSYATEVPGAVGDRELGLEASGRVLPASRSRPRGAVMQNLALFDSATLNGYDAVTGHLFALSSPRLRRLLPIAIDGRLQGDTERLWESHLLATFGLHQVVVAPEDRASLETLNRSALFRRAHDGERAVVFSRLDPMPRAYFADAVRPWDREALERTLIDNRGDRRTAFVAGWTDQGTVGPGGRVGRILWGHEEIEVELEPGAGGFLVVSCAYHDHWRAEVDGRAAPVWPTNGAVLGVEVPPGAERLRLHFEPRDFHLGLVLATLGSLVLAAGLWIAGRTSSLAPSTPPGVRS